MHFLHMFTRYIWSQTKIITCQFDISTTEFILNKFLSLNIREPQYSQLSIWLDVLEMQTFENQNAKGINIDAIIF